MLNKAAPEDVDSHYGYAAPVPVPVPVPSINAFSALHLLRNYNQLLMPPEEYKLTTANSNTVTGSYGATPVSTSTLLTPHALLGYQPVAATVAATAAATTPLFADTQLSPVINRTIISSTSPRRQRGEKKPIPDEQKDDKYFERRRRNNQAAKKSRDARKLREDQIAFRATMLEHENAILRAQILTLREEASSLRQMLILKKTDQTQAQTIEHQINCR